jgi:alkylhydroperoxidase/carboxymuconolactone decarboxylase family protein YurZ
MRFDCWGERPMRDAEGPQARRPPLITGKRFIEKRKLRESVDPHFARISLDFAVAVAQRPALDTRSCYLALLGQFAVTRSYGHLEDALGACIEAEVPVRDALEAILLSQIYSGETVLEPALAIFVRVITERGLAESLRDSSLPPEGAHRDLERERLDWPPALLDDPRSPALIEAYGWKGVSTGVRYRGAHHLDTLDQLGALDQDWTRAWEQFTYEGMYSRWVLDDKTRLLCTTADCIALGAAAAASARDHMEEALDFGNSPREMLDMILLSGLYFGFPGVTAARNVLVKILQDRGQLAELTDPKVR